MTIEEDNVALLRRLYAAWDDSKASPDSFFNHLDPDVTWTSLSNGAPGMEFSRPFTGKANALAYYGELGRTWSMNYYRAKDFIAQGDRVVVISDCSWTHRVTGRTVETPKVDVLTIRNGLVTEVREFYDTARAEAAGQP